MTNHRLKNKENGLLLQKEMSLIEKGITTKKNLQAATGDLIAIDEVPAIGVITVVNTIRIMTGDTGVNTNADMSILPIEGHTHQNTGEEITTMIMNQDQDHQHTLDIKLIKKTVRTEEGDTETHLDDHGRKDQGTTHLMTARDTKNTVVHIANRILLGRKSHREIEVLITRTLVLKETETKMTIASRMEKEIP